SGLLQVAAYVSYTPNDPSSFYLGDAGFCTNLGTSGTISFQVQIQPGHSFDVVVQECVQNTPASYTLSTTAGALDGYVNTNSPSTTRYLGASGPSGCGSPPPTPPLQVAGFGVRYAAYTFVGNLGDCETASLSVAYSANFGVNAGIIGYAYSGSFDPNNPDQNYLGDSGQCADLRTNTSQVNFSWRVP